MINSASGLISKQPKIIELYSLMYEQSAPLLICGTDDFLAGYRYRSKQHHTYARQNEGKMYTNYLSVYESGAKRKLPLTEKILHAAWVKAGQKGLRVKGRDGTLYKVIYAGRPSPGYGPDFLDAVLEGQSGERMYGNIEIHVRQNDWQSHKHHRDERYNGVLFHVCLESGGTDAITKEGRKIPLLLLSPCIGSGSKEGASAEKSRLPIAFLDMGTAGDKRFADRAVYFGLEIDRLGIDQALYAGIMECLGYPNNKRFFYMLASKVPWVVLAAVIENHPGVKHIYNHLLSAANLPVDLADTKALKKVHPEWVPHTGRPYNHPLRRIKGAASMAVRMASAGGPSAYCERFLGKSTHTTMAKWFIVGEEEEHAFIGKGRAGEIIINAILPGLYALARKNGDEAIMRKCMGIYREYPALPSNSILRAAVSLLKAHGIPISGAGAREQQGMIHCYRLMVSKAPQPRQLALI